MQRKLGKRCALFDDSGDEEHVKEETKIGINLAGTIENDAPTVETLSIIEKDIIVQVEIPESEAKLVIDKFCENLLRLGPDFERRVKEDASLNSDPRFAFLFDPESRESRYFQWRLQDQEPEYWSLEPLLGEDGATLIPPPWPFWSSDDNVIDRLSIKKKCIAEFTVFALDHEQVVLQLIHAVIRPVPHTPFKTRLTRLYALSDLYYNASKVCHNAFVQAAIANHLEPAIAEFARLFMGLSGSKLKAERVKSCVSEVVSLWFEWNIINMGILDSLLSHFKTPLERTRDALIDPDLDGEPL